MSSLFFTQSSPENPFNSSQASQQQQPLQFQSTNLDSSSQIENSCANCQQKIQEIGLLQNQLQTLSQENYQKDQKVKEKEDAATYLQNQLNYKEQEYQALQEQNQKLDNQKQTFDQQIISLQKIQETSREQSKLIEKYKQDLNDVIKKNQQQQQQNLTQIQNLTNQNIQQLNQIRDLNQKIEDFEEINKIKDKQYKLTTSQSQNLNISQNDWSLQTENEQLKKNNQELLLNIELLKIQIQEEVQKNQNQLQNKQNHQEIKYNEQQHQLQQMVERESQLEKIIQEQKEQIQNANWQISQLVTNLNEQQQLNKYLQDQVQPLAEQISNLKQKNDQLSQEKEKLAQSNFSNKDQMEEVIKKAESLESEKQQTQLIILKLQEQNKMLMDQQVLQSNHPKSTSEIENEKIQFQRLLQAQENQTNVLMKEKQETETQLNQAQQYIQNLNISIQQIQQELNSKNYKLIQMEQQVGQNQTQQLTDKIQQLEKQAQAYKEQNIQLEQQITIERQAYKQQNDQITILKQDIANLQKQQMQINQQNLYSSKVSDIEGRRELEGKIQQLEQREQQLQDELQKQRVELQEANKNLIAQQNQNEQLVQQQQKLLNQNQQLEQQNLYFSQQQKNQIQQIQPPQQQQPFQTPQNQIFYQVSPRKNLLCLKEEYKHNQSIISQIESLLGKFNSYRHIRGDGNCYFRAIGFAYLEHLCRITTSDKYLRGIIYKFQKKGGYYQIRPDINNQESLNLRNIFLGLLGNLLQRKNQEDKFIMQYLEEEIKDNKNNQDEALVWEMRCLTTNYLEAHRQLFQPFCSIPYEEFIQNILTMGQEVDGLGIGPLQIVLEIRIIIQMVDKQQKQLIQFEQMNRSGLYPVIYILYKPGHYDIIYTKEQSSADGFNYINETFQQFQRIPERYSIANPGKPFFIYEVIKENECPFQENMNFQIQCNQAYISTADMEIRMKQKYQQSEKVKNLRYIKCENCTIEVNQQNIISLQCQHNFCNICLSYQLKEENGISLQFWKDTQLKCAVCKTEVSKEEVESVEQRLKKIEKEQEQERAKRKNEECLVF